MKVAFDRLVKPDGTIQLPLSLAGSIVTILLPDVREDRPEGLETLRQVASAEEAGKVSTGKVAYCPKCNRCPAPRNGKCPICGTTIEAGGGGSE